MHGKIVSHGPWLHFGLQQTEENQIHSNSIYSNSNIVQWKHRAYIINKGQTEFPLCLLSTQVPNISEICYQSTFSHWVEYESIWVGACVTSSAVFAKNGHTGEMKAECSENSKILVLSLGYRLLGFSFCDD